MNDGRQQGSVFVIPHAAIEQADATAINHRSYEKREPFEVRVSNDHLTVMRFLGQDRSIRLEDLQMSRTVSRRYRSQRLGKFLKTLDLRKFAYEELF